MPVSLALAALDPTGRSYPRSDEPAGSLVVDVSAGGTRRTLTPDADGRLPFTLDETTPTIELTVHHRARPFVPVRQAFSYRETPQPALTPVTPSDRHLDAVELSEQTARVRVTLARVVDGGDIPRRAIERLLDHRHDRQWGRISDEASCRAVAMQMEEEWYIRHRIIVPPSSTHRDPNESLDDRIRRVAGSLLDLESDRRIDVALHPCLDESAPLGRSLRMEPCGRDDDPGIPRAWDAHRRFPEPPPPTRAPGWPRFSPSGRLFFLQRNPIDQVPALIAVWVPTSVRTRDGAPQDSAGTFQLDERGALAFRGSPPTAIDYHVFFHPANTGARQWGRYPGGNGYFDMAFRYLMANPERHDFPYSMQIIDQHAIANRDVVLVFPVGTTSNALSAIANQASMLELLSEVNDWLFREARRDDTSARPAVGRVALSGFSFGARTVANVLTTEGASRTIARRFMGDHLREVYAFDGAYTSSVGDFGRWFATAPRGSMMRIYTRFSMWLGLSHHFAGATRTEHRTAHGADAWQLELERSDAQGPVKAGTLLFGSTSYFAREFHFPAARDDGALHKCFPAFFVHHAIARSGFRSLTAPTR